MLLGLVSVDELPVQIFESDACPEKPATVQCNSVCVTLGTPKMALDRKLCILTCELWSLQIDLPFTTFGKALASRTAIQKWIHDNMLEELKQYLETHRLQGRRGIIHHFLDCLDPKTMAESDVDQRIAV